MASPTTERVGNLIRAERTKRALTTAELAHRAGLSEATVSRVERGKTAVTLATADCLLEAMDLRLHIEAMPLWADIDEKINEAAQLPLAERIPQWPVDFAGFVTILDGIHYQLDGLAAAAVQGAPVIVDEYEIAIPRDDEQTLDQLTITLAEITAKRGESGWEIIDPREPGADFYRCLAGPLRFRFTDSFSPALWADIDPLPEPNWMGAVLASVLSRPLLTRARLAVVPLTDIQARDDKTSRIIKRVQEKQQRQALLRPQAAPGSGAGPGAAGTSRCPRGSP